MRITHAAYVRNYRDFNKQTSLKLRHRRKEKKECINLSKICSQNLSILSSTIIMNKNLTFLGLKKEALLQLKDFIS